MGEFIGGAGAAFIMAAAAAVVVKFLLDINVIKSRENVLVYGKIALLTVICGVVYWFAAALMYNEMKGQTNFFKVEDIFRFLDISHTADFVKSGEISGMFSGILMPVYPLISHIIGKLVFEQYMLTAQFISFTAACVSACAIYSMLIKRMEKACADTLMLILASIPFVFLLFTPSCYSLFVMFTALAAYSLSKGAEKTFIVLAVLAVLTCKLGIIAFLIYPARHWISSLMPTMEKRFLKNGIYVRIVITALLLISGAVLCYLIRRI